MATVTPARELNVAAEPVSRLSRIDRFLPLWIFTAMALGIALGRLFPDLGEWLDRVKVAGVSLPIAIGLLWMMYPVLAKVRFETLGRENTQSKFDLTLNITEEDEQLKAEFEYNTDLYDAATIERLAGHFTRLLEGVIADPQQRIGQLSLLDDAERQRVLAQSNGPATDDPGDATLHSLFEAQATRTPEALAVTFELPR